MATFKCWLVDEPEEMAEAVEHKTPLEAARFFASSQMSGEDWESYDNAPDVVVQSDDGALQVFEARRVFDYVTRENHAETRKLIEQREYDAAEAEG